MTKRSTCAVFCITCIVILSAKGVGGVAPAGEDEVVFYEDVYYDGEKLFLRLGIGCYTMPKDWSDRISSVDTNGHCITVWDEKGCKGNSVQLDPEVSEADNLSRLQFNDIIASIKVCKNNERKPSAAHNGNGHRPAGSSENKRVLTGFADVWRVGLLEHNKYRRMHGVPDLNGDVHIHEEAQRHAEYLAKNHKFEGSGGKLYGENLATSYEKDRLEAIREVVSRWYAKISYYNFRDPESNKWRHRSAHFSSIVWRSTTQIGVGVAYNRRDQKWVIVCMYNPPATTSHYRENVPPPIRRRGG